MSRPDWKQWVEASKAERRNLVNRKVFTVLTDSEVERLQQGGVTIHTAKNVLKTKINAAGEPYKYKARVSFRGFTEIERYDFHETFAAVASSAMVRLIVSLAVGTNMRTHQMDVVGAYLYAPIAKDLYVWAPKGIAKLPGEC